MFFLKIKNKTILSIFFLCICYSFVNANVVINEYSASNLTGYVDNYSLEQLIGKKTVVLWRLCLRPLPQ